MLQIVFYPVSIDMTVIGHGDDVYNGQSVHYFDDNDKKRHVLKRLCVNRLLMFRTTCDVCSNNQLEIGIKQKIRGEMDPDVLPIQCPLLADNTDQEVHFSALFYLY